MGKLSHLDEDGSARMVDVSAKAETAREAVAEGRVVMSAAALALVTGGANPKGDVQKVAEIAGILAAKRTAELIPLCHPLPLDGIEVKVTVENDCLRVLTRVKTSGRTGVEMEALTAASVACLTIYDMVKAADRTMVIEGVRLLEKRGGKTGEFVRDAD